MDQWFSVGLGPHKNYRHHRETIDILSQAITQRKTVQMRYFSAGWNATNRREVDPYRLRYVDGGLYLIAYCHWRKDVRMFAVERITSLTPTDHPYQVPLHFDIDAYVEDALVVMRGELITVELRFDKPMAVWVKDRIWHPSQQLTPIKGGELLMTLQVANTRELLGSIFSFGCGVRVLKPERLQKAVAEEAGAILRGNAGAGHWFVCLAGLGVSLVGLVVLESGSLFGGGPARAQIPLPYMIAVGMGFHNLGGGLAIGASYTNGKWTLSLLLVAGFALHNGSEGFGIVGASGKTPVRWMDGVLLGFIAGAPTCPGALLSGQGVSPYYSMLFYTVAAGSLLYVIFTLTAISYTATRRVQTAVGVFLGISLMHVTAMMLTLAGGVPS